jgi:hypothetical protein
MLPPELKSLAQTTGSSRLKTNRTLSIEAGIGVLRRIYSSSRNRTPGSATGPSSLTNVPSQEQRDRPRLDRST